MDRLRSKAIRGTWRINGFYLMTSCLQSSGVIRPNEEKESRETAEKERQQIESRDSRERGFETPKRKKGG